MNADKKYYGLEEWEILSSSIDEACERIMDDYTENVGEGDEAVLDRIEFPLKVFVFQPRKTPSAESLADGILESTLDNLDCEYADPDGDSTDPSEKMREAALALGKIISEEYVPWSCTKSGQVVILERKHFEDAPYPEAVAVEG